MPVFAILTDSDQGAVIRNIRNEFKNNQMQTMVRNMAGERLRLEGRSCRP